MQWKENNLEFKRFKTDFARKYERFIYPKFWKLALILSLWCEIQNFYTKISADFLPNYLNLVENKKFNEISEMKTETLNMLNILTGVHERIVIYTHTHTHAVRVGEIEWVSVR